MTNTDLAFHYVISFAAALAIGSYVADYDQTLATVASLFTFFAVSWLQTYDREHRRNQ